MMPMKNPVDLENAVEWISDSKTANGVAEVPLTEIAVKAFVLVAECGESRSVLE